MTKEIVRVRRLSSWIDEFVKHTKHIEASVLYRRWAAISAVAAALERNVWVYTGEVLYPNLYTFLVGPAGIGKSRSINFATGFLREIPELHIGPTSVTSAALIDCMSEAKRIVPHIPGPAVEYHSLLITPDELSVFMSCYDNELIATLTKFYDCTHYAQSRRTTKIRIVIENPQLNFITGTTPANLMSTLPELAWQQGFTSRVIMVYADDRGELLNIFRRKLNGSIDDLVNDIKVIHDAKGEFVATEAYIDAQQEWKESGFSPEPKHPKLEGYNARRYTHVIKLSIIAAIDRGAKNIIDEEDFFKALAWLQEVEAFMPEIFKIGNTANTDSNAMREIQHQIQQFGKRGVPEQKVIRIAQEYVSAYAVKPVLEVMERSGMIQVIFVDERTGSKTYVAN